MPSTFMRVAVDFVVTAAATWSTVPDALASTANYLARPVGCGEPWGYEVKLPQGFDESLAGARSADRWRSGGDGC